MSNLKFYRENIGMSLGALSNISGINIKTIQRYETIKESINTAPANKLYRLSKSLGCRIEDLLEGLE